MLHLPDGREFALTSVLVSIFVTIHAVTNALGGGGDDRQERKQVNYDGTKEVISSQTNFLHSSSESSLSSNESS